MTWIKTLLLTGLFSTMLANGVGTASAAEAWRKEWGQGDWGRAACRSADRMQIRDLDFSPDPIIAGQRVRAWRVQIFLEGNRECTTEVEVREGGENVGRVVRTRLRPGINNIEIQPNDNYRFQAGEHCFNVVLDLDGTRRPVDAARRFCAQRKASWSLRERNDYPGNRR